MQQAIGLLVLGLAAGGLSGMVGIGGGVLIVPALVYFFGLSQQQAQGTTLALLIPPIGLAAAWTYYKQGFVDLRIAGLIILGFIFGSYFSAQWAVQVPAALLRKIFGSFLFIVSLKMIFGR